MTLAPQAPLRRLHAALAASIGLNVLLVAFVAAHHWLPPPPRHGPPGGPPPMHDVLRHLAEQLPPADAAVLRRVLDAHHTALQDDEQAEHQAAHEARDALQADTLDPAALRARLEAVHQARSRVGQDMEAVLLEAAPAMSREGRARLADEHRH